MCPCFSLFGECFNSQPPEGGWFLGVIVATVYESFNSQPPEGGWIDVDQTRILSNVSTHSRPKAAGQSATLFNMSVGVSTHSRPKAAGLYTEARLDWRYPSRLRAAVS